MNYWKQQTKQLNKALEKDEERLKRRLVNYYKKEAKRLDKEIASFYQRYGENNMIEYRKLLQQMSSDDIQLLYEDMNEFARKYPQYSHLMPTRANIYKLTRLEGLQQSVYMAQLRLGAITDIELTAHLEKQAKRYGRAADTANGKVFNMVNEQTVKGFVNNNWSNGKNFSQRIWDNAQKLADTLNTELAQGFARGEAYEKLTKQITDKFETVSRNNAYRLIYTEGTYVMNESSIQGFSEDFEQYEYSVVEDGHACPICTDLNGKVFNIKDRVPGVNFPPMHPWCRCTFKIHVDDWSEWLKAQSNKTRAQKVIERLSSGDGKGLTLITDSAINKVPLISTPKMTNADALKLQALHKELLEYARDNNNSEEVAFLVNSKFEKFDVIKGDIESLDLTGKSAKYILHNHPNNSSFSMNDIVFLTDNKSDFISVVKNNGSVELLEIQNFNYRRFVVEVNRLEKKYQKDIANNLEKGYTKVAGELLKKTKSGLILRR